MEAFNIEFQQSLGNVLWDTWRNPLTAACKVDFLMYECIWNRDFQITFNTNLSYRISVKWFMGNVDIYFMVLCKCWLKSMRRLIVYLKRSIYGLTEAKHCYGSALQNIWIVQQVMFGGNFPCSIFLYPQIHGRFKSARFCFGNGLRFSTVWVL